MTYSSQPLAQLIVSACKAFDIKDIVISPGSRNAPLILGFASDDFFNCYSVVDERSAAFFALGIAQQRQRPVALVCSSGSAMLNYYPAVAEAFYSDTPLIVISADRPANKIDIGDGQTIRQQGVFTNHIVAETHLSLSYNDNAGRLADVFTRCIGEKGPVHLNVPFEEPLYQTASEAVSFEKTEAVPASPHRLYLSDFEDFLVRWNAAEKRLVLVGQLFPGQLEAYRPLLEDENVLVLTETLSNLPHHKALCCIDNLLVGIESHAALAEHFQPDILLTFGGMIVSKKIKAFLRSHKPRYHYHVDEKRAYNTYFCLTHHFKVAAKSFIEQFPKSPPSDYATSWRAYREQIRLERARIMAQTPYSDLQAYRLLLSGIPSDYRIQLGNSSAVRYAQLFGDEDLSHHYFGNRGVSGIDGCVSTSVGAAVVRPFMVLLVGDLSFFYDSNALWNGYVSPHLRIIVVNNGGGGIFRFIANTPKDAVFERFMETAHRRTVKPLVEMHSLGYRSVHDASELAEALKTFFLPVDRAQVLEVFTPQSLNADVLEAYFQRLKEKAGDIDI